MNARVELVLLKTLPAVDYDDLSIRRQFAAEYTHSAYKHMRSQEMALGNYCKTKSLNVRGCQRKSMIVLME